MLKPGHASGLIKDWLIPPVRQCLSGTASCKVHRPLVLPHNAKVLLVQAQGLTAPSNPPGAEPFTPVGQQMTGASPLNFHDVFSASCTTLHNNKG